MPKMSRKNPACEDSVASRTRSKADKQLHVWQGEYDYRRTCDDEKNSLTATPRAERSDEAYTPTVNKEVDLMVDEEEIRQLEKD